MSAVFKRRQGSHEDISDAGTQEDSKNIMDELFTKKRKRVERLLQYILPPVMLASISVGLFMPSYRADPVSKFA